MDWSSFSMASLQKHVYDQLILSLIGGFLKWEVERKT